MPFDGPTGHGSLFGSTIRNGGPGTTTPGGRDQAVRFDLGDRGGHGPVCAGLDPRAKTRAAGRGRRARGEDA
jgi:hypothetical protein